MALADSLDMADHGYPSHITPHSASPYDRIARAGIRYRSPGANIGVDSGVSRVQMLRRIVVAMLNSPEHRAKLLCLTFTRVGIGIAVVGTEIFITEDFKH